MALSPLPNQPVPDHFSLGSNMGVAAYQGVDLKRLPRPEVPGMLSTMS